MLQIYSHIEPLATIRAVGKAKPIRKKIKERFQHKLRLDKLPRGERLDHGRIERQWARLYRDLGWNYLPLNFA